MLPGAFSFGGWQVPACGFGPHVPEFESRRRLGSAAGMDPQRLVAEADPSTARGLPEECRAKTPAPFQTRDPRTGTQARSDPTLHSAVAQTAERAAVNRVVGGSTPPRGARS